MHRVVLVIALIAAGVLGVIAFELPRSDPNAFGMTPVGWCLLAAAGLILLSVIPWYQAREISSPEVRLDKETAARDLVMKVLAGVILATAVSLMQTEQAQREKTTEQFDKANAQLTGNPDQNPQQVVAGLTTLERIAKADPGHRAEAVNSLEFYLRAHSSLPPTGFNAHDLGQVRQVGTIRPAIQAALDLIAYPTERLGGPLQRRLNLKATNLAAAQLQKAEIPRAIFISTNLSRAKLNGANLQEADLGWAWLHDADLRDAHLAGANLTGAHLEFAQLEGADLSGTLVTGKVLLRGATWDERTKSPPGVDLRQATGNEKAPTAASR
jgi:hypothetical protein